LGVIEFILTDKGLHFSDYWKYVILLHDVRKYRDVFFLYFNIKIP
jgi:hypothetical protein